MDKTYTKEQIRDGFAKWLGRIKGLDLKEADNPDELADYLVEVMDEEPQPEPL